MNPSSEDARLGSRDAYLAWQADIGTEDVVLVEPWTRPARATSFTSSSPAASSSSPFAGARGDLDEAPRFQPRGGAPGDEASSASSAAFAAPAAGESFFQSIAAALAKPEPFATKSRPAAAARAPEPPPAAASEIPELKDLDAYWAFLESVYPKWYPGSALPLARAVGSARPALAVVEFAPSGNEAGAAARVFAGESGALLDRMLKAIDLKPEHLYLTSLMKTPPPGRAWSRRDAARMLPAFLRELRMAQCGLVLLLGETCAQIVMRTGQSLAALEEQAVNAEDLAFTATWHPEDLLKNEALKRDAWKHLKWVRARLPAL